MKSEFPSSVPSVPEKPLSLGELSSRYLLRLNALSTEVKAAKKRYDDIKVKSEDQRAIDELLSEIDSKVEQLNAYLTKENVETLAGKAAGWLLHFEIDGTNFPRKFEEAEELWRQAQARESAYSSNLWNSGS